MLASKQLVLLSSNPKTSLDLDFAANPAIPGGLTATRSTTGTVVDFEGLVRTAKIDEVRFQGARRVENLIPTSNLAVTWTKGGTPTITPGQSDMVGGFDAFHVVMSVAANFIVNTQPTSSMTQLPVGTISTWTVDLKSGSGASQNIILILRAGNNSTALASLNVVVTTSWQRFSIKGIANTVAGGFIWIRPGDGTNTGVTTEVRDIYIGRPSLNDVTLASNQAPPEYLSVGLLSPPYYGAGVDGVKYFATTNGNTVASNVVTEDLGTQLSGMTLLAEEARTNLLLNSATPATQNITTTAQSYTISMWGTGTCTLTGTATGTLTGTSATTRVSLTVTATAGTLTLTFAGTNTNGQAEAGASMSSYIPTTTAVTRTADALSFTGTGLSSWYNPQQGTFVVKASGQYSSAPGNIGVWNPLLTGAGSYAITYNKTQGNNAYLWLPNAQAGVNPLEYQDIPTPTAILLGEQGILNMSRFTYYPKAFKANKVMALVSGTLTTIFDVSYAATTDFTNKFRATVYPYGNTKAFPKINLGAATVLNNAWVAVLIPSFPLFNTSTVTGMAGTWLNSSQTSIKLMDTAKVQSLSTTWQGNTVITAIPALNFRGVLNNASGSNSFNATWNGCTNLATVPPNLFDNTVTRNYTNAFLNCALTQTSVDNILVSIAQSVVNTPTLTGGTLNMTGGTSATPSATGLAAKAVLVTTYNWTVTNN